MPKANWNRFCNSAAVTDKLTRLYRPILGEMNMNSVLPSTNFENKPFDSGFDETVEVTEKWRAMKEQERQQAVISFLSSQEKYKSIQVSSADERGRGFAN